LRGRRCRVDRRQVLMKSRVKTHSDSGLLAGRSPDAEVSIVRHMTRTAPRQSSETTHARRHVTRVVAHRADGLTDRLLAFGDRVEIAHDYRDREAEAEGLDCLERPHAPTMSRGDGRNDPADRLPPPQAAGMSCYSVAEEITSICADFLVELRGRTSDLRSAGTRALDGAAASGIAGLTPEAAPLNPDLGRAPPPLPCAAPTARRALPRSPTIDTFGQFQSD
jgi:hypothetical protein